MAYVVILQSPYTDNLPSGSTRLSFDPLYAVMNDFFLGGLLSVASLDAYLTGVSGLSLFPSMALSAVLLPVVILLPLFLCLVVFLAHRLRLVKCFFLALSSYGFGVEAFNRVLSRFPGWVLCRYGSGRVFAL